MKFYKKPKIQRYLAKLENFLGLVCFGAIFLLAGFLMFKILFYCSTHPYEMDSFYSKLGCLYSEAKELFVSFCYKIDSINAGKVYKYLFITIIASLIAWNCVEKTVDDAYEFSDDTE